MTGYNAPIPYNAGLPYNGDVVVLPTLTLTSISPVSGPYLGGQLVRLVGTLFGSGMTVTFDGQVATNLNLVSPTVLEVRTPTRVGAAGMVDVTVSDSLGDHATLVSGYSYDAALIPPPPPSVPTTLRRLPYVAGASRVRVPYVTREGF